MMTRPETEPTTPGSEERCAPTVYMTLLERFVETGEVPHPEAYAYDALAVYLLETMSDATVRALVLNDPISARAFLDTMIQFVSLNLDKARYRLSRASGEMRQREEAGTWNLIRRQAGWRALVGQLDERYGARGFERGFYERELGTEEGYADDALWQSLMNEWQRLINQQLADESRKFVESRGGAQRKLLETNLQAAPAHCRANGIGEVDFCQTWALMGGRWNATEYERLSRVARLQRKYPVLLQIVNRMGRVADTEGVQRLGTTSGRTELMEHAAQSDIAGVGMGRNLGALLPLELAQFLDPDTEDVFLQKYLTARLQTFDYRSRMLRPARSLHTRPARPKGPMIVCADTSGSMMGEPSRISVSLMMRLTELCARERRACYLIAFSVRAQPIDILRDRTLLLEFFTLQATGDTDARHMLDATFSLLRHDPLYAGADVLWITDFRIPMAPRPYLQEMERLRHDGTHFYGLQLGIAENHWRSCFDEIFRIEDVRMSFS